MNCEKCYSSKNIKQKEPSMQNKRRLLPSQEVRGMEDALTPRPSTSTATTRPSLNPAEPIKTRPKTAAVKKSVCSNPPCISRRSKDPPLSDQDNNANVDLAHVIKVYGRLEKTKVSENPLQDLSSQSQARYIPSIQLNATPQTKESRSIGVSMDSELPSQFCGSKSGPCVPQHVAEDTANASTSTQDPMQAFVNSSNKKYIGRKTGSGSPRHIVVSKAKVPCEGNQGPCSFRVSKTQDKSTAAPKIRATSTPQYRNIPRNSPPNLIPMSSYPHNDKRYYQQVPRSPQSFNASRINFNTQNPQIQEISPNMGQQYLQSNANISRLVNNMDHLQVPHSPRYDRSASLVRNPQESPSAGGSYRQPTSSYYQRDEIGSGQYQEYPPPQFSRFSPSPNRQILPPTRQTPDHSVSIPDVPDYGYTQRNFSPVRRSVPSVRYESSPVRRVSPNRRYISDPRIDPPQIYSRVLPPVEGNVAGFYQKSPQRRQVGKPDMPSYVQQKISPRLTQRRESDQQTMREASMRRPEKNAQSNVIPGRSYAGNGPVRHTIISKPRSSITKNAYSVGPPVSGQNIAGSLQNRNEAQRRSALPVRQSVTSRPQPITKVSRVQKPSQLPSRSRATVSRISPKKASVPQRSRSIEADLGQSFQEFVSRSEDVSKQGIDQFNQSKIKKINENIPNKDAASKIMNAAARRKTMEKKAALESIRKRQEEAKLKHETQRQKAAKIYEAKRIAKSLGSALTREEIMALVKEENKDIEAAANSAEVLPSGMAPKEINSRAKILKMKGTVRPPPEKKSVLRKAKVDQVTSELRMSASEGNLPTPAEDPKKLASVMIRLDPVLDNMSPILEKSSVKTATPSSVAKLAVLDVSKNMDTSVDLMSLDRGVPVEPTPSTSTDQQTRTLQTQIAKKLFSPEKESMTELEKFLEMAKTQELFGKHDLSKFGDLEDERSLLDLEEMLDIPDPDAPSCNICRRGTSKTTTLKVQLRGSQPPSWFPGYLTVLPQSNPSSFMLSRTPSIPMAQAWKATEPDYYSNESQMLA